MSRPVGEILLTSKLRILNGNGHRRPSLALSILTGRVGEEVSILEGFYAPDQAIATEPDDVAMAMVVRRPHRQFAAHTVYLSEAHLEDLDQIIQALQQVAPRRLNRSAVMRRAVEYLRTAVQDDPAKFMLEND
jgi:hypothetical protein